MSGVGPAESAILLCLHPVGMGLLVLGSIVVTLFALSAGQSDSCTHFATSICFQLIILCIKKRPVSISFDYYNTKNAARQLIFSEQRRLQLFPKKPCTSPPKVLDLRKVGNYTIEEERRRNNERGSQCSL